MEDEVPTSLHIEVAKVQADASLASDLNERRRPVVVVEAAEM